MGSGDGVLANEWGLLEGMERTRGILRLLRCCMYSRAALMASGVTSKWER